MEYKRIREVYLSEEEINLLKEIEEYREWR